MAEVVELEHVRRARQDAELGVLLRCEGNAMECLVAAWAKRNIVARNDGAPDFEFYRAEHHYFHCADEFIEAHSALRKHYVLRETPEIDG
jgi:hypothetical protein